MHYARNHRVYFIEYYIIKTTFVQLLNFNSLIQNWNHNWSCLYWFKNKCTEGCSVFGKLQKSVVQIEEFKSFDQSNSKCLGKPLQTRQQGKFK